jgi:hypothetical protein
MSSIARGYRASRIVIENRGKTPVPVWLLLMMTRGDFINFALARVSVSAGPQGGCHCATPRTSSAPRPA